MFRCSLHFSDQLVRPTSDKSRLTSARNCGALWVALHDKVPRAALTIDTSAPGFKGDFFWLIRPLSRSISSNHFVMYGQDGYTSKPSFGRHCTLARGGNVLSLKHFAEVLFAACFAMVLTTFLGLFKAHGLRSTFLVGGTCLFLKLPGLPPLPLPAWQNTEGRGKYHTKISTESLPLLARLLHISRTLWFHLLLCLQTKVCNAFLGWVFPGALARTVQRSWS